MVSKQHLWSVSSAELLEKRERTGKLQFCFVGIAVSRPCSFDLFFPNHLAVQKIFPFLKRLSFSPSLSILKWKKKISSSTSTTPSSSSEGTIQQQPKKIVERLSSAVVSGLRSFPLPDLDEDSKAMISELISPPPPVSDYDDDDDDEESELEDSDDDFTRTAAGSDAAEAAATAAAAAAAVLDDASTTTNRKKKPSSPPALGARGGGWVLAQFAALFFVIFPPTAITLAIQVAGIFAILGGVVLAAAGVGSIGVHSLSPFPVPRRSNQLAEKGAYSLVRHPMYGGLILFATGAAAASASPGRAAAALALFFILENKMILEEKGMRKKHGAKYDEYTSRTRKAIPFLW